MRFQPRRANSARVSCGVSCQLREGRLGALEDCHSAREVERLLLVEPRDARVGVVGRAEALLGLALLVVFEGLLDLEHSERAAFGVCEDDAVPLRGLVDGEADGQGPRQAVCQAHLVHDAHVIVTGHEPLERRERARGDHVQIRELP